MKDETMNRLMELDDIHLQIHCAVESVRQSWVAMTQGDSKPDKNDYDALYGIYRYLSEQETRLLEWKESFWKYSR